MTSATATEAVVLHAEQRPAGAAPLLCQLSALIGCELAGAPHRLRVLPDPAELLAHSLQLSARELSRFDTLANPLPHVQPLRGSRPWRRLGRLRRRSARGQHQPESHGACNMLPHRFTIHFPSRLLLHCLTGIDGARLPGRHGTF